MSNIHLTAIIDSKAEIDKDVEIGPYCVIDGGVSIAKACRLDSHVRIKGRTSIGPNNQFFHSCTVGEAPQDISFKDGPHSTLSLGEGNVIREHAQIHCSTLEQGTVIGNHNYIMSLAHVAHDAHVGDHNILVQGSIIGGHCTIEDHVYIGGLAGMHPYVRIGSYAIIAGLSGVRRDVPPYVMAEGARCLAYGLNSLGMRRANFSIELRKAIKRAYKILFEGSSIPKGIARIKKELMGIYKADSEEFSRIKHFVDFIENSKRSIISAKKSKGVSED